MDNASIIAQEDRISNLPDDLIHHIFSFLDLKYAIQFCTLSRNWKDIWASNTHLHLNDKMFLYQSQFVSFVDHALSHRNNETDVSSLELTFDGPITHPVVQKILNYAYLHNVEKLTIDAFSMNFYGFQPSDDLYKCHTLKHLTLAANFDYFSYKSFPGKDWDFPALETISLSSMYFYDHGDNFFSKCVNLKELTVHKCSMFTKEKAFNICAPRLSNLTITDSFLFPKVLKVVAPQLKNLTATVVTGYRVLIPYDSMHLSTNRFDSLEKVTLFMSNTENKKPYVPVLINLYKDVLISLFKNVCNARFLVLNMDVIEILSLCLDQLSHEPCPLDNLKCLKIVNISPHQKDLIEEMVPQVRKYLLGNSPSATFIMDSEVPLKRSHAAISKRLRRWQKQNKM